MTHNPIPPAAPMREDLFGPPPAPLTGARHRGLRLALARLLLWLGAPGGGGDGEPIAALRAAIDAANRMERQRVRPHPLLESWLPKDAAGAPSLAELALLVESLAAAAPTERAAWGRRIQRRYGALVAEELVQLAEAEEAIAPLLRARMTEEELRAALDAAPAQIPPARVQAALALAIIAAEPADRAAMAAAA